MEFLLRGRTETQPPPPHTHIYISSEGAGKGYSPLFCVCKFVSFCLVEEDSLGLINKQMGKTNTVQSVADLPQVLQALEGEVLSLEGQRRCLATLDVRNGVVGTVNHLGARYITLKVDDIVRALVEATAAQ